MDMKVRVGVAIVVFDEEEGCILIGKRKNAHGANEWALPGGKVEPGETTVEAAIRELHEETGLSDGEEDLELVNVCVNHFPEQGIEWVTVLFKSVWPRTPGVPPDRDRDKKVEWVWVKHDRMPYPLFTPLEYVVRTGILSRIVKGC